MPFDAAPTSVSSISSTDCSYCPVRTCLGRVGGGSLTNAWSEILAPRTAVMPGDKPLFREGDNVWAVYTVRGGCLKTYTVDAAGKEHIRGFYLPGDLVGLDSIHGNRFRSTAAAVAPSQVCSAPVNGLGRLMERQPEFSKRLMEQTSRELSLSLALSGDFTAEQRLAAFLLHMQERLGSAGSLIQLPMPQRDIGNYLRLATETVCRTLKGFEKKGWLRCEAKGIRLLSRPALFAVAEPLGICQPTATPALAA